MQPGDVITSVAGQDITSSQQLTVVLANLDVGKTVPVVVQRNGSKKTLKVTLGELPAGG
jgi:S1-C subfamily serine protease